MLYTIKSRFKSLETRFKVSIESGPTQPSSIYLGKLHNEFDTWYKFLH